MNLGMGLGLLAYSVAIGALFAVVFAVAYGRVGDVSVRQLSLYIAGGMLLSLYVITNLKYPANPPALSLDQTVRERTLLYVLMVVLSAALLIGAVVLARRWVATLGVFNGWLAAAGGYAATMALVMLVLPTINETPAPLRDAAGAIVYEAFPPMSSTTSGSTRSAPRLLFIRHSAWCSVRSRRGWLGSAVRRATYCDAQSSLSGGGTEAIRPIVMTSAVPLAECRPRADERKASAEGKQAALTEACSSIPLSRFERHAGRPAPH